MITYSFRADHVTIHDLCAKLGIGKTTMVYWLKHHEIPHVQIMSGKKVAVTLVPLSQLSNLQRLNRIRIAHRDHLPSPEKDVA